MTAIHKSVVIPPDHRLRMDFDIPAEIPEGTAEVTLLISTTHKPDKRKAIECLRELARNGGIQSIPDPVAWQREVRKDRSLPGRD